jgi:hypothetical protein
MIQRLTVVLLGEGIGRGRGRGVAASVGVREEDGACSDDGEQTLASPVP